MHPPGWLLGLPRSRLVLEHLLALGSVMRAFLSGIDFKILRRVSIAFVAWRLLLFFFNLIGTTLSRPRHPNPQKDYVVFPHNRFWDSFFRWDSGWYKRIAEKGYYIEGAQSDVVFFPLYPYLSRALGFVVGDHHVAGLLISNAATLGGCYFMVKIGERLLSKEECDRSLVYFLVFPTSFFFSAYYSEGLFFLTLSASVYHFLGGHYFGAGIWGLLAALTRSIGMLLLPIYLLCIFIDRRGGRWVRRPGVPWLGLIPCGVLLFMGLLAVEVGDPLAFVRYQAGWGREATFPLWTLAEGLWAIDWSLPRDAQNTQLLFDVLFSLAFLSMGIAMLRGFPLVFALLTLGGVLMPLASGELQSMTRYVCVLFPAHIFLARKVRAPLGQHLLMALFALFLGLFSVRFANWYWAG